MNAAINPKRVFVTARANQLVLSPVDEKRAAIIRGYVILVIWSLFLAPSFSTPAGIPSIRLDDILLILVPAILVFLVPRIHLDRRILILMFILLSIELGILSGALLGYQASLLDHFVWLRLAKTFGAIVLASALASFGFSGNLDLKWLIKVTVMPGLLLCAVVLQQFFDIASLNQFYVAYVAPTQYETLLGDYPWPRPVGMIGNPNELSFLLGILVVSAFWMALQDGTKTRFWFLVAVIFFVFSGMTLSRSGIFAIMGSLVFLVASRIVSSFKARSGRFYLKKGMLGGSVFALASFGILALSLYMSTELYEQFLWRFNPDHYGSFYQRVQNWEENLRLWASSPIFGVGTLKHSGDLVHAADNEWLLLLRIGGFPLVVLTVLLLLAGVFKKRNNSEEKWFARSVIIGAFLYMIPAAFFYSLVIMPLVLIMLVIAAPSPWKVLRVKSPAQVSIASRTSDLSIARTT